MVGIESTTLEVALGKLDHQHRKKICLDRALAADKNFRLRAFNVDLYQCNGLSTRICDELAQRCCWNPCAFGFLTDECNVIIGGLAPFVGQEPNLSGGLPNGRIYRKGILDIVAIQIVDQMPCRIGVGLDRNHMSFTVRCLCSQYGIEPYVRTAIDERISGTQV